MVITIRVMRTKILTFTVIALLLCAAIMTDPLYSANTGGEPAAAGSSGKGTKKKPKLDVGYQPTPYEVVKEMLKLSDVRKDDIVYDLGCGDGRIVIMAAKERGARGVGVDLDPQRIKESRVNARKAGVTDRVRFFQKDLFTMDIREATVVMLYLWPEVNLRLRPKLFAELKPGARVLSHNHNMGEWQPDLVSKIAKHTIYFWVMPANIAGAWTWPIQIGSRKTDAVLRLKQDFQKTKGTLTIGSSTVPVADAKLKGMQLSLSAEPVIDGQKVAIKLAGKAEGDALLGTMEISGGTTNEKTHWKAKRSKD